MRTVEFEGRVSRDRTLTVPPEVAKQIRVEESVRVILVLRDSAGDHEWARLTIDQFLAGYADGDAMYDHLPAR